MIVVDDVTLSKRSAEGDSLMRTDLEDPTSRREQRGAMLRVFGGTALAFVILLVVAALVRPDLMEMAGSAAMSLMR